MNNLFVEDFIERDYSKIIILNKNVADIFEYLYQNKKEKTSFILGEAYHKYYDIYKKDQFPHCKIYLTKTNMIHTNTQFSYIINSDVLPSNIIICEDILRYTSDFFHNLFYELKKNRIKNIILYSEINLSTALREALDYQLDKIRVRLKEKITLGLEETRHGDYMIYNKDNI
jgi:hypothetical protein